MDKVKGMITINIVLTVIIAIALVIFAFITLGGDSSKSAEEEYDSGQISLTEQEIDPVKLPQSIISNVYSLENGKQHTLRMDVTVVLDSKHDDYESVKEFLLDTNKIDLIVSDIHDIVRAKSYEEIKRADSKQILEEEILELLKKEFNSDCFVEVDLPGYFHD